MVDGVLRLGDGRRLYWHEFGVLDGLPVLYTAGTPVSGLIGGSYHEAAKVAGLRWISPDKPGYGRSDFHRGRSLCSWSEDLRELADRLSLERFALAGESGGGPVTLVAAHLLQERVSVAALIASGGPTHPEDRPERANLKTSARVRDWLARHAPALNTFDIAVMRRQLSTPAKRERILRRELAANPGSDEATFRIEIEAAADALRQGTRATVQELTMNRGAWPFPLAEIKTPIHLWHGTKDRNAPISFARRLAKDLPDATLHLGETSGHDIGPERSQEITSVLASYLR